MIPLNCAAEEGTRERKLQGSWSSWRIVEPVKLYIWFSYGVVYELDLSGMEETKIYGGETEVRKPKLHFLEQKGQLCPSKNLQQLL